MSQNKKPGLLGRQSFRKFIGRGSAFILLICLSVIFMIPLIWMLITALTPSGQEFSQSWLPEKLVWSNFIEAWKAMPFTLYMWNTILITALTTIGQLLSSSIVAYGFARLRFPGRDMLFILVLATMMIPFQVTLIPQFLIFAYIHWINSFKPLIIPSFFGAAFNIFLIRQFIMSIPHDLDDAAQIDGCGYLRTYWQIILPLCRPALATVAIFSFMYHWNDFLGPLIYLDSADKRTLSLGLSMFSGYYSVDWNYMMAVSLLVLLPCLLIFFFTQKYFIRGVVISGLKG
jgi:multiple sugar transport system permease protein